MASESAGTATEIWTVGHSNVPAEQLVDLLTAHGIALVVDVRSAPYSQYAPQFNRENVAHTLQAAGIAYAYAGDTLGGRPQDPACYKGGAIPAGNTKFLEVVDYPAVATRSWYRAGLDRLLAQAAAQPTAIMCSEEDPARCHRHHLIAQTLLERGVAVWHLRHDGRREAAQPLTPQPQQLGLFTPTG